MEILVTIFWILKIIGSLGTIVFTYVKYKDYKKKSKEKDLPDAATSDKPVGDCNKQS